mmetsp:Transcript_28700/g.37631  ORF Transcript_28700/g.37631 Transcript_28700/m.37631 type:complete len:343 (+) Transcript_28700:153-1181(+)
MQVLVTGGKGFLASRLCREILAKKQLVSAQQEPQNIQRIILWDSHSANNEPNKDGSLAASHTCSIEDISGDICDKNAVEMLFDTVLDKSLPLSVFHLASMMSGQGEECFEECYQTNVNGTKNLLEGCKDFGAPAKFVFTSSIAAVGPTDNLSASTRPIPQSTYGATKAIAELLVNEYSRRGFVDGRVGRLPTVIVRPGPPNAATTGSFSNIVKALIQGESYTCPIPKELQHPVISYQTAVTCLHQLHDVPAQSLGNDRIVNLPAIQTCLRELEAATISILGQEEEKGLVGKEAVDLFTTSIVEKMASGVDCSQAKSLKLQFDHNIKDIIKAYCEEHASDLSV